MRGRYLVLFLVMAVCCLTTRAQNVKSVNIAWGVMYPQTVAATLSYEVGTKHHNAWEFSGHVSSQWEDCPSCGHICPESFWKGNRMWGLGVAYKPCVIRTQNAYGSLRFGGSIGSDCRRMLGGIHAGYEHNHALKGGWRLFWQVNCDCLIGNADLFRTGIAIGIKIPTNSTR